MSNLKDGSRYQPEIDGLRAIAVLSVILFHLNESILPGGFLGVDIFFVLSGYLITSNIYDQLSKGTFSFAGFYNRRMKRLLPSLYVVLGIFIVIGLYTLLPGDLRVLQNSIQKIVFFWANHHFALGRNYFDPQITEMPFLHTWSLAIEEQFYFAWPLVLFILVKWGWSKKAIIVSGLVGVSLSFIYAEVLLHNNESTYAYYSFLSRFGELLAGATLAISNVRGNRSSTSLTVLGIATIVVCFIFIDKTISFPGVTAIPICLGTIFFLYSSKNSIRTFFAWTPLVFIGKISYQLYLWHWPIFAYLRYIQGHYSLDFVMTITSLLGIFTISYLGYRFVEFPIRYSKMSFRKTFFLLYVLPTILILMLAQFGARFAFQTKVFNQPDLSGYGEDICHKKSSSSPCLKGAPLETTQTHADLLMFGDSHAAHYNSFIDVVGKIQGWSAFVISGSSCSPILDYNENLISDLNSRKDCAELKKFIVSEIDQYRYIAISSRWDWHLGLNSGEYDKNFLEKLRKTLVLLQEKQKIVYVFAQVPAWSISPQRYELIQNRIPFLTPKETENKLIVEANSKIQRFVSEFPNVVFVNTYDAFSLMDGVFFQAGRPLHFDENHINIYGARTLAEMMIAHGRLEELKIIGSK